MIQSLRTVKKVIQVFLVPILILTFFSFIKAKKGQHIVQENNEAYVPIVLNLFESSYTTGNKFQPAPLDLEDFRLFDLGVTDQNADNALDLFTANHSARQSFLLNDGLGEFSENMLTAFNLDQTPEFPGLEDSSDNPLFTSPGLYIYWRESILVFHAHQMDALDSIIGSATFFPEIVVSADDSFTFDLISHPLPDDIIQTKLEFRVLGSGDMLVTPLPIPSVGSPILFSVDPAVNLNNIFIGIDKINPSDHTFQLQLKDRHGMAWHDYNNDNLIDVYMSRGGNRGLSDIYPLELTIDEFYLNGATKFTPVTTTTLGFVKDGCAARQVGWVDYNQDNLLDLYIVCARGEPNQLYRQDTTGQFTNVANTVGLALRDDGHFAWLDADGDLDIDMFWAGTGVYRLYVNQTGTFERQEIITTDDRADKLTIGDYDLDGDPDIFAASPTESYLFNNTLGVYSVLLPETIGLPNNAFTANWVDYDNDGLLDLHVIPGGLYRQQIDHTFQATGVLKLETIQANPQEARASWFDADRDGRRDVVISTLLAETNMEGMTTSKWVSGYFRNITEEDNNWLTIKLIGLSGNREALGTTVVVETKQDTYKQEIGWSEGSRYSQGNYQLYFGLGSSQTIEKITIIWSNNDIQILETLSSNQFLTIEQDPPP